MRILFIEPCHKNFGGYFRAINICSALSKKGIQVDLLLASGDKFSFGKKTVINKNLVQYELPRFYLHFFINGRIIRGLIATFFGIFQRYDIIHACVPVQLESNIPAFILKCLRKRVVIDWDDLWDASTIYGEYWLMKKYVHLCELKAPRFFENMVVVSELLERLSKERGAKKVLKLINGVNTSQFKPHDQQSSRKKLGLNPDGKYLISFGNTFINDRALLLFSIFDKILKLDPEVTLLFNFDPKQLLGDNINKISNKCLDRILNVGYIQQQDLGWYLGVANASILIIGDSDNERANFPIRIGSYINGESIVILNDVGSEAGNTLKKLNCSIIEKDQLELVKKTVRLLNDKKIQEDLKGKVLEAKKELDWNNLIDNLIDYYNEILI